MSEPILIIGGGIGGLCAAIAIAQTGRKVRVYEQTTHLKEVGAGLTLSPNAGKALYALGLEAALEPIVTVVTRQGLHDYATAEQVSTSERDDAIMRQKYGAPYVQCHRADLHDLLVKRLADLAPDALQLGHLLSGLTHSAAGVTAEFSDGRTADGTALIGADGMRSVVRASLFGADAPRYTGRVAYRTMIPFEDMKDLNLPERVGVAIGPNRSFASYPVRNDTLLNVVALGRTDGQADEDWGAVASVDEVLEAYEGWNELYRSIIAKSPGGRMMKWGLFDRPPMESWSIGRVTLLGDAAHPALPYMGMGAALAIEDAVVLGRCIDAEDEIATAFKRYKAARLPRASLVQIESARKADNWEADDGSSSKSRSSSTNEESLGLFSYDAASVAI